MQFIQIIKLLPFVLICICNQAIFSQPYHFQGQFSGWTFLKEKSISSSQLGLRYIPELSMQKSFSNGLTVDSELSLKIFSSQQFDSIDRIVDDGDAKPYRLWLRFTSSQLELRIGLQKINFGSATILRPLMWFDRLDPRDPLRLTNGIYGLLGRYYFLNNANIWLWGLYGNDETKGWEVIPTDEHSVEYGGRIQYPFGSGEIALTYHRRQADPANSPLSQIITETGSISENRIGLDGKWDLEIGLWFEGVVIHQESAQIPFKYRNFLTWGVDYTFPIGTGLHVISEHLYFALSEKFFDSGESFNFSAFLVDYSPGMLDRLMAVIYYDWENKQFSRYASWGRIYDNWSFYLNVFWNPEETNLIDFQRDVQNDFGTGKGLQLMVVFNH